MSRLMSWVVHYVRRKGVDGPCHVYVQAASATAAYNRAHGGPCSGSHAEETTFDGYSSFGEPATVVLCLDTGKIYYVVSVEHG